MSEPDKAHLIIPRHKRLAMALEARVDPRTIDAILRGQQVKGDAGQRAREVLRKHGFIPAEGAV